MRPALALQSSAASGHAVSHRYGIAAVHGLLVTDSRADDTLGTLGDGSTGRRIRTINLYEKDWKRDGQMNRDVIGQTLQASDAYGRRTGSRIL